VHSKLAAISMHGISGNLIAELLLKLYNAWKHIQQDQN